MVSAVGVIGAIASGGAALFSFLAFRENRMLRADEAELQVQRRSENVSYVSRSVLADLRQVVITERDGFGYEFRRHFLFGGIEGSTELFFALKNVQAGRPADVSNLRHDEENLENVLGDLYISSKLYEVHDKGRFKIELDTADPAVLRNVCRFVAYHLTGDDKQASVYDYFVKRSD